MSTSTGAGDRAGARPARTPLLGPRYRGATTGAVALVFLAAFEALAVATVMPAVTRDLDGRAWFSVAFSATLAASVVGMVADSVSGLLIPRRVWTSEMSVPGHQACTE